MVKNNNGKKKVRFISGAEKNLRNKKEEDINKYYQKIGDRLKRLKFLSSAVLLIIIFGGLVLRAEDITIDNITYLWRYMDIIPSAQADTWEFKIESDETSSYGYYRNNIAVLKRSRLDIYDMTGRKNSTYTLAYSNPVMSVAERYILTYDLGMNKLDIFNSVSQIYAYIGESPIFSAKVTDTGFTVYVTRETGYKSVIKIMNNNFDDKYAVYRVSDYIMDADIDSDAKYLAAAGFDAENGDYLTSILLYRTDERDPIREITMRGEMPYRIKLNGTGFCAVLENSIRFYDLNGKEISAYSFAGRTRQLLELSGDYSAVVLNEKTLGNDSRILVFDNSGNIICEQLIDTEIIDIKFSENYDYLYFLTRTGIYKITMEMKIFELLISRMNEESEAKYDETAKNIVFADDRNIYLAGLSKVNILENRFYE